MLNCYQRLSCCVYVICTTCSFPAAFFKIVYKLAYSVLCYRVCPLNYYAVGRCTSNNASHNTFFLHAHTTYFLLVTEHPLLQVAPWFLTLLTVIFRVQSSTSPCGTYRKHNDDRTDFSPSISVLCFPYHSTCICTLYCIQIIISFHNIVTQKHFSSFQGL